MFTSLITFRRFPCYAKQKTPSTFIASAVRDMTFSSHSHCWSAIVNQHAYVPKSAYVTYDQTLDVKHLVLWRFFSHLLQAEISNYDIYDCRHVQDVVISMTTVVCMMASVFEQETFTSIFGTKSSPVVKPATGYQQSIHSRDDKPSQLASDWMMLCPLEYD